MSKSDYPHKIKAGAVFKEKMESDPKTKAALARTWARLQAFDKAIQAAKNSPEYREAKKAERQRWQDRVDAIRARMESAGDEGLTSVNQAIQSVTPISKTIKEALAEALAEHERSHPTQSCDRLLVTLYEHTVTGVAVMDLPDELRDAELLTVMDADGLIAFGRRNHCHVGPVNAQELRLEKGWTFTSVTNDHCKPMTDWLMELANEPLDSPIRHHVRLTKKGQIEASRIVLSRRDAVAGRTEGVSEASDDEAKASELVAILNTLCVQLNRAMELLVGKSRLHAFWFSADKYSIEKAARLLERLGCTPDARQLRNQYREWLGNYNAWFTVHTDETILSRISVALPIPEAFDDEMRESRLMSLTGRTKIFCDYLTLLRDQADQILLRIKTMQGDSDSSNANAVHVTGDPRNVTDTPDDGSKPDENGYVANPSDPTAFVPQKTILADHMPAELALTPRQLGTVLKNFKANGVTWTRPRSNRKCVHLAQWLRYVARASKQSGVDEWPDTSPDEQAATAEQIKLRRQSID